MLLGLPGDRPEGLAWAVRNCPRLRWVQATVDGAGRQVRASGLTQAELAHMEITQTTGVHAGPLSEFCLFARSAHGQSRRRLLRTAGARQPAVGARERLLSPHTEALTPGRGRAHLSLFARNLRRFLAGEELEGSVDVADGY